ncbi:nucleotidyl transferase AbiEii/AbiGii toxin family protein [Saccharicrinis sp. 156]|uniref:nucleotidyl transferase AbiEii/AbiGii toxin family protein n=1 Tax=Saccharicrinis sp. 156 TaxID=3417574 RepID=UPI003D33106D
MIAVSEELRDTIHKLQKLPSLSQFALAGGTNLALRYNHRKSVDIDLFSPNIVGRSGFKEIEDEINQYFGSSVIGLQYPCDENDQFIFLRCFIVENGVTIKVEILQNMKFVYDIEVVDGIRLISKKDIGLFKLESAANRKAKKDIYDLDYITDEIPLVELFDQLKLKKEKFCSDSDRTIFDLDNELGPIENPKLLLEFENSSLPNNTRPVHSNDTISIMDEQKSFLLARMSWRTKVRKLFSHLGLGFPEM